MPPPPPAPTPPPVILKAHHTLVNRDVSTVLAAMKTTNFADQDFIYARVYGKESIQDYDSTRLTRYIDRFSGKNPKDLLSILDLDETVETKKKLLHCIIIVANDLGQPPAQSVSPFASYSGPYTLYRTSLLVDYSGRNCVDPGGAASPRGLTVVCPRRSLP